MERASEITGGIFMKITDKGMLFSRKALVALAVPVVLESLTSMLAGFIDTVMVSHAGEAAVSGVSLMNSISTLLVALFFSLTVGGSVSCSHYIGAGNFEEARTNAKQLLYSTTLIATLVALFLFTLNTSLINVIYPKIEQDIFVASSEYLFWVSLSMPFLAVYYVCTTLLRITQRSKTAFMMALLTTALHLLGNAVLIYGFEMGVRGAAIALLASRIITAAVCLTLLYSKKNDVYFEKLLKFSFKREHQKKILSIGVPYAFERASIYIGELLIASLISGFGTSDIAANAIVRTVCAFGWCIVGNFDTVILTVTGVCFGAKKPEQVAFYAKKILTVTVLSSVIIFSLTALLRAPILSLFDITEETRLVADKLLLFSCLLTFIGGYPFSYVPLAIFRAVGDTKYPVVLTFVTMFVFRVSGSFLFGSFLGLGIFGVYIAEGSDWLFRAICNGTRLLRGKWKEVKDI